MSARAITPYQQAASLALANQPARSDTLLLASMTALGYGHGPFAGTLVQNMAPNAYREGNFTLADSLNEASAHIGIESASYWLLQSASAVARGDTAAARLAIRRSLDMDPTNTSANAVSLQLGVGR